MTARAIISEPGNTKNVYWLAIMLIAAGLGSSTACALDFMGPPTSNLKQGQINAGIDYSHSTMDLELKRGTWVEYLDGVFDAAGDATSFTLKDFETNRGYAHLGCGIADNWEVFLRLGGTNAEFGHSIWEDGEEFDSKSQLAVGGGIKATFYEDGNLKLGGLFQASWAQYDGKLSASHWAAADFVEMDISEIQIAIGPTYKFTDHFAVYGGPFFHFVDGNLDDDVTEWTDSGLLASKYSWDVEEDSTLGAYIGAEIDFAENWSFTVEYQHTSAADAIGLSLIWRF